MDIIQQLKELKRPHRWVDNDNWYSCPLSPRGCDDPTELKDVCNCGADSKNKKLEEIIKNVEQLLTQIGVKCSQWHKDRLCIMHTDLGGCDRNEPCLIIKPNKA